MKVEERQRDPCDRMEYQRQSQTGKLDSTQFEHGFVRNEQADPVADLPDPSPAALVNQG
jgi:hypothetical protein